MESIYYVMTWLCHRTCEHCYEERFHPYHGEELSKVVEESTNNWPKILRNLPDRFTWRDPEDPTREHPGTIILAGGEILLEAVRETVLYPALRYLHQRYAAQGGVRLVMQTTGDLLTPRIAAELFELHVNMVSVSGIDSYHAGLETREAQARMMAKCIAILEGAGFTPPPAEPRLIGQHYHFFGATEDQWIGKLWPRGRAWRHNLGTATLEDNFCNQWSGGLHFLDQGYRGSEVSIDPAGNVFPCCVKTRLPVGNLLTQPLTEILASKRGNPVYEAISAGQPERMGLAHGWTVEKFLEKSKTQRPDGTPYANLCIGCDAFHDEVLAAPLVQLSAAGTAGNS